MAGSKVDEVCPRLDCTGCGACAAACAFGAISVSDDGEGFPFPSVSPDLCTGCGKCRRTCPSLNGAAAGEADFYMAWSLYSEVLARCSSGGVFDALASCVLDRGGAVFGARLDQRTRALEHACVCEAAGLDGLRRSKYFQSRTERAYARALAELDAGSWVLFTGTPCQVAGLLALAGRRERLVTMDVLCHGVTSGRVVESYVSCKERELGGAVESIGFRAKRGELGWAAGCGPTTLCYSGGAGSREFVDEAADGAGTFFAGYTRGLFLRESCYCCRYCSTARVSDFTAADFWGLEPGDARVGGLQRRQGVSILCANTERARGMMGELSGLMHVEPITRDEAVRRNGAFLRPAARPELRDRVFADLEAGDFDDVIKRYYRKDMVKRKVKGAAKAVLGDRGTSALKRILGR